MVRKAFDGRCGGGVPPSQAVWEAIRRHPSQFDCELLSREACVSKALIRRVLRGLSAAGVIELVVAGAGTIRNEWRLVRDMGPEAPRVTTAGEASNQGARGRNLWRTMRVLGEFDAAELAGASSVGDIRVSIRTSQEWITALSRAGYLVRVSKAAGGPKMRRRARYALPRANWTGPLPPIIGRDGVVYDQNNRRVVWSREGA